MRSNEQRLRDVELQLEKHRVRPRGGSGRPYATKTIAAADSSASDRSNADFVCTGTDDQVQILAAMTAANYGNLTLLDGNYYLSAPIAPLLPVRILIQGSGKYTSMIQPDYHLDLVDAFHLFVIPGSSYIELRDLQVMSSWYFQTGTGNALHFETGYGNAATLTLRNADIGGWTWGVWGENMQYCIFEDSNISGGNDADGPYVGGGVYGNTWEECVIDNCDIGGATYGIQITNPLRCTVSRNRISYTGSHGMRIGS